MIKGTLPLCKILLKILKEQDVLLQHPSNPHGRWCYEGSIYEELTLWWGSGAFGQTGVAVSTGKVTLSLLLIQYVVSSVSLKLLSFSIIKEKCLCSTAE